LTRPQCYHLCKIVLIEKLIKLTKDNFTASKRLLIGCITSHIQYKKKTLKLNIYIFFRQKATKNEFTKSHCRIFWHISSLLFKQIETAIVLHIKRKRWQT